MVNRKITISLSHYFTRTSWWETAVHSYSEDRARTAVNNLIHMPPAPDI
ncbi:MAG: hypothetical protein GY943_19350 [Chloroflexi bacterium]|nr:hypothetical protein [Chloroflexota bacterium]